MLIADVADEPDLACHADLADDISGAIDRLAPSRAFQSRGNGQAVKRFDCRGRARVDFGVIQEEHADSERDHERTDEQAEIKMEIARPPIERLLSTALGHHAPLMTGEVLRHHHPLFQDTSDPRSTATPGVNSAYSIIATQAQSSSHESRIVAVTE